MNSVKQQAHNKPVEYHLLVITNDKKEDKSHASLYYEYRRIYVIFSWSTFKQIILEKLKKLRCTST